MNGRSAIGLAGLAATAAASAIASFGPPGPELAPDLSATKSPERVFSVTGLTPGSSKVREVALRNDGSAAGVLRISQMTEPASRAQRDLLENLVIRVVERGDREPVYVGAVAGLIDRSLGRFDPGQTRVFRFAIGLAPAAPGSIEGVGLEIPLV